jgi:hypothetical protein
MQRDCAVLEALVLCKQPAKARKLNCAELPVDMLTLIKIAAGDEGETQDWSAATGETTDAIRQAAVFFLQQTIAKSGDDAFRVLGLPKGASQEDARLHKRWLLKWLHPDRNHSKWESVLFHRVVAMADSILVEQPPTVLEFLPTKPGKSTRQREAFAFHPRGHKKNLERRVDWRGLWLRIIGRMLFIFLFLAVFAMIAVLVVGLLRDDPRFLAYEPAISRLAT